MRATEWPAELLGLDQPGLYSWWVDPEGAIDLSAEIGAEVREGRIYEAKPGPRNGRPERPDARHSPVASGATIYEDQSGAAPAG